MTKKEKTPLGYDKTIMEEVAEITKLTDKLVIDLKEWTTS